MACGFAFNVTVKVRVINKPDYVSLIKHVNCKINKVLFKTNHGVIKFLLRNKTIVESSQLMLPKLITKNKFIFRKFSGWTLHFY